MSHDAQAYLFVDVGSDDLEQEGHEEPRHEEQVGVQACDDAHSRGRRPICILCTNKFYQTLSRLLASTSASKQVLTRG